MASIADDWTALLEGHPIFSLPKTSKDATALEFSVSSISKSKTADDDSLKPFGRRQLLCVRDSDIIVASGSEIRMASLTDAKASGGSEQRYKALHTPNIQFEIRQISLCPNGKILAVCGDQQVAVIILPRTGFSKLVTARIDCKSIQIGQYYHATSYSPPVAKMEWHPWGDAGSTLLIMTVDGKLREYDISVDTEEPQQTLDFIPSKSSRGFAAQDELEREVASFTLGRGNADWGPLTLYALMKSGDVFAMCPYMPKNASIPSSYIHALECYVAAKQEFLSEAGQTESQSFSTLYDYQRKYVNALMKQLPPGTAFPSSSRSVTMHPPKTMKNGVLCQGPFLFQPAPPDLEGSSGGEATDITYTTPGNKSEIADDATGSEGAENLGVILVAFQDGRIDVCFDLDKVEARWRTKENSSSPLPVLAVYETIDLDLVKSLCINNTGDDAALLENNHLTLTADLIYEDTIYVYHAFGVHMINLRPIFQNLALASKEDDDEQFTNSLEKLGNSTVQHILTTYSVEKKASDAVVAVTVPNDVYLTYSVFIITASMKLVTFPLNLRNDLPEMTEEEPQQLITSKLPPFPDGEPKTVSALASRPFEIPAVFNRPQGLPAIARLSLPPSVSSKSELQVTPDTLRYLGKVSEKLGGEIRDVQIGFRVLINRNELQRQQFERQQAMCRDTVALIQVLKNKRQSTQDKIKKVQEEQKALLHRMDRILQTLINKSSPDLNEHETKWFDELQRMKRQVLGTNKYDQGSLRVRINLLQKELERLQPNLKGLAKKEEQYHTILEERRSSFGLSQSFMYGKKSEAERVRLEDSMRQVSLLAQMMQLSLGRPPMTTQNNLVGDRV